jgi:predicted alpha/beta-hydrolase family hydrolase
MGPAMDLVDGPKKARWQVVLGHGAGAPMDSPFMQHLAQGLAKGKVRVVRFEFPYMAARRANGGNKPPDRPAELERAFREVVARHPHAGLVIGGKSLGGRVAARLAGELGARGLVCLGYPFHPPGNPEKSRLETLTAVTVPALVVQGTRDPFGTREEVKAFRLKKPVRVHFLEDGDHSFEPRKSSGRTGAQNLDEAVKAVLDFLATL